MALKRNEMYPGRFENPTGEHPQGAFKNRTAPNANDGSYLEQAWANDWSGFFEKILTTAGVTANGTADTALASQYYDALIAAIKLNLGTAAQRNVGTSSTQIPDMSYFTSGGNQWYRFPDGTILQRGTSISGGLGSPNLITLPIPFLVGFSVVTSYDTAAAGATDCPSFAVTNVGLNSFRLMSSRASGSTGAGANWIALGR